MRFSRAAYTQAPVRHQRHFRVRAFDDEEEEAVDRNMYPNPDFVKETLEAFPEQGVANVEEARVWLQRHCLGSSYSSGRELSSRCAGTLLRWWLDISGVQASCGQFHDAILHAAHHDVRDLCRMCDQSLSGRTLGM